MWPARPIMSRPARFITALALASVLLLLLSAYLHSWGGVVLLVLGAIAIAWYRAQVAEGEAAERFFGDMGEEETRLPQYQGGSPSEMPLDRTLPGRVRPPADRS
jgi:hypothetical protein